MTARLKSALQFIIFLGLGLGLMYFAFVNLNLDYEKVMNGFRSANYGWIVLAVFVSLASHLLRALRWNLLFEPLELRAKPLNAFNAVMIGYMFNFAIPRMGEVSRCGILLRTDRIPMDKSLGTVVVERVFDMVILLVVTFAVLLLQFDVLYGFFDETLFAPMLKTAQGIPVFFLVSALLVILAIGFFIYRNRDRLMQSAVVMKLSGVIKGFADGFRSVFRLRKPGMFLFQTLLIWALYFLNTWCYLMAFEETSHIGFAAALCILVVGTFGFAAPVSGGIGAYHIFVAKGLALYGVSSVAGGVFGFVSHGMQMIMILVVGAISLLYTIVAERRVK